MPRNIQFYLKGDVERKAPIPLVKVDEHICNTLKVPTHPVNWYLNWFNHIGMALVLGHDLNSITKHYEDDPDMLQVLGVLMDHYTYDTWISLK